MMIRRSTQPALLGGPPAVTVDEPEAAIWPQVSREDEKAVVRVLRSGELSLHPETRRLEADYRRLTGRRCALAHCNGTAALLAAFFALDLKPGDEVLVPSATFWASVVPMLWVGAVPVFCDVEDQRLGLDPEDVERKITSRSRALVVVHLFGLPARMRALRDVARRHGLKIIEDASHAHGASWHGRPCGSLGDVSVFSLQSNKLAPAGEGGVLLTDRLSVMQRAVSLGDMMRAMRLDGPLARLSGTTFGIKTRLAPLSAALGRSQLKRLSENNARRADNLEYLSSHLKRLGITVFSAPRHARRVYFAYVVRPRELTPGRKGRPPVDLALLVEALKAEGCRASAIRYPMLHQQPLFRQGIFRQIARLPQDVGPRDYAVRLPRTEAMSRELIQLPAFHSASRTLLDQYAQAFEKVLDNADAVAGAGHEGSAAGSRRARAVGRRR
ncbi:MAG TPA: DegT/DnrJ/EryC1/StrS family aminotransferase [Acidobacteriota bacterium]|nr:DegT/DnrJ/EryC1/StrS family aminotransferase [Acidobacteriota bacterium]